MRQGMRKEAMSKRLSDVSVEGVVLAGIHTWGQCVLEYAACWPIMPVAGRPLMEHHLRSLREAGIQMNHICANSHTRQICGLYKDGSAMGLDLHYYEDPMPRGPGGCIRDVIAQSSASTFVSVDASLLPQISLTEIIKDHLSSGAIMTVVAAASGSQDADAEHRHLQPCGIYVFSREIINYIPTVGYQDIKEVLIPRLYTQKIPVRVHMIEHCQSRQVRGVVSYLAANKWFIARQMRQNILSEGYTIQSRAAIHHSARVHASARVIGPVVIGANCRIDRDAVIVGPTVIGDGCHVGEGAVINGAVIWSKCCIGTASILYDCILTDNTTIEPWTILRNTACIPDASQRFGDLQDIKSDRPAWPDTNSTFSTSRGVTDRRMPCHDRMCTS